MTKPARSEKFDPSAFGPPESPLMCATCSEREATCEVQIWVRRGLVYEKQRNLYSVTYAVCGECARDVVEVKLSAKLRANP